MSKQFEQLELLYKQILYISKEIKKYIDKTDYDEVLSQANQKSQLVLRANLAKKTIELTAEEENVIENLRKQILENEEINIKLMSKLRDSTIVELKALNNQTKLTNKYEQNEEPQEGTICDYTSD